MCFGLFSLLKIFPRLCSAKCTLGHEHLRFERHALRRTDLEHSECLKMHVQILMVEIVLRIAKFLLRVPELCLDLEATSLRAFRSRFRSFRWLCSHLRNFLFFKISVLMRFLLFLTLFLWKCFIYPEVLTSMWICSICDSRYRCQRI